MTAVADLPACENGCIVAKFKGGMSTNGGCRCLEGLDNAKRINVTRALYAYRAEVEKLTIETEEALRLVLTTDDANRALKAAALGVVTAFDGYAANPTTWDSVLGDAIEALRALVQP